MELSKLQQIIKDRYYSTDSAWEFTIPPYGFMRR